MEEETGLKLGDVTFAHVNNNVMSDKLHYITIFMRADVSEVCMSPRLSAVALHASGVF